MKKFIFIFLLAAFSLASSAQIGNLFKPIDNVIKVEQTAGVKSILDDVVLRLNVGVTTTQSYYDKVNKEIVTNPMSAIGFGLGIQHYTLKPDGTLFNDYGANLLYLVQDGVNGVNGMGVGLFGNLSIFQLGVDYNFTLKRLSVDTGITLKF